MVQHPIPPDLGQQAYAAYSEATGGLTHDDQPMLAWDALSERTQTAWTAVGRAVFTAALTGGTR